MSNIYKNIKKDYSKDFIDLFNEAKKYYKNSEYEKAIFILNKLVEQYPNDYLPYLMLGNIYSKCNKTENAIKNAKIAVELNQNDEAASLLLFNILRNNGMEIEAFNELKRFQKNNESEHYNSLYNDHYINYSESELHLQQGIVFKNKKEFALAINEFNIAIEMDPNNAVAYQEKGWLYYVANKDLQKAYEYLLKAIQIDDSLGYAYMYIGIVLNKLEKTKESEANFLKAIELIEEKALVNSFFAEAFLWRNSRYGEAEEHFKLAIENDPNCYLALRDYARMLSCHGRDDEAEELFNKAIALDPTNKITKREYNKFLTDKADSNRDIKECLLAAIKKDPNYIEGIKVFNEKYGEISKLEK